MHSANSERSTKGAPHPIQESAQTAWAVGEISKGQQCALTVITHNGFMETTALGTQEVRIYIYIYIYILLHLPIIFKHILHINYVTAYKRFTVQTGIVHHKISVTPQTLILNKSLLDAISAGPLLLQ